MRSILFVFVALTVTACSGRSTPKVEPSSCVPGESQVCVCQPGVEGVQVCTATSVFEACRCDGIDVDMGSLPDTDTPDGGTTTNDMAGCVPETDAVLCAAAEATCGGLAVTDRCGQARTPECGTCANSAPCIQNVCCVGESNAELCAAEQAVCGAVTVTDSCGLSRSISDCGVCGNGLPCVDNQCSCGVETTFFGQIDGLGLHDGGVPTTAALSGNSGLSQIASAIPLTDGSFSTVDIPVSGATVISTSFDSRANETFWLQDGVTVGAVRLAIPSIFVDVRVGDIVSFRATELQNFEGHPQISGLQDFSVLSSDNFVQYADRTGQPITIADYGKVVRVGGTVGAGTPCGGASTCYPLNHGSRVSTYRTASAFVTPGECVTFVGPVGSFPGPLSVGAEPQLDAVNFGWAFTQF